MDLTEVQGKRLLGSFGVKTPVGKTAASAEEAQKIAVEIGGPVVVKAQTRSGHRHKAGGVLFANTPGEALGAARSLLGSLVNGERVGEVLVEERLRVATESYAGITIDDALGVPVLICLAQGGTGVEDESRATRPVTIPLDPLNPVAWHELLRCAYGMGGRGEVLLKSAAVLEALVRLFFSVEAITAEINPLAVVAGNEVYALDAKIVLDDSASFRRAIAISPGCEQRHPLEEEAREAGLQYVQIDERGEIGVIAGGAGLAMATVDLVSLLGGKPANFLDTGGGVTAARMSLALRLVLRNPHLKGVLINVFGGINNCLEMSKGVSAVLDDGVRIPIVVKMRGHSQDEGWALLEERGVLLVKHGSTEEAIRGLFGLISRGEADYGSAD
ncbi:MAG: succinate--CoA ligase [Firmicutes bacterium]|nr:succinate--CoA ligase [Bacillota bacterium]